ncbi:TetR/AcrR family transcriptional regulator [Glycomyces tenuis]|uniref:TetR/AcrR family transcriptional regulator n=1 Tax=Glycomyces tenuis TaxID=58116 RepID=UPI0004023DA0|nr:TetR/AcrR family transcriptional regulator [Glycomyces tenuis]
MTLSRRTQADRSAATRAALIAAGRTLFAQHGFAGVGTEAIVREASVSRGALYHQFGDKTELFAAVLDEVEHEIAQELVAAAGTSGDGDFVELMLETFTAWLDACQTPHVQRIVLIDGPSVLGWARWRAICQHHVLGLVEGMLSEGVAAGALTPLPVKPLAHVLLAMADEAALYVDAAPSPAAAQADMVAVVRPLIEALARE